MIQELYGKFKKDTKIVAYARFNQSKRLARKSWWSLFSISAISFSLIMISIGEKFFDVKEITPLIFTSISIQAWVFSLFCSIVILALSVAISSSKIDVRYEKITASAIKINKISREVELEYELGGSNVEKYESLLHEYNLSLITDMTNHDEIDFHIAKLSINNKKVITFYFNYYFKQYLELFPYILISIISLSTIMSVIIKIIQVSHLSC
ncbi:SLATT domain-containing protein [Pseudoalteromonas atlantica]|uniref:SLATT domain-containing protein n=1 Tax=Pseudoalteromonas atlantica TaxID=288 RepID=UPI003735DFD5